MSTLTIHGRPIFYKDMGSGFPLIFAHSYLWDSDMWSYQTKVLAKHYRCISIDMWGHGQSGILPTTTTSLEQLTDAYEAFIKALGFKAFAFIGLSVGGMIGAHLALRMLNEMRAFCMTGSYVGAEYENAKKIYFDLIDEFNAEGHFSCEMAEKLAPYFFDPQNYAANHSYVQEFKEKLMAIAAPQISSLWAIGHAIFSRVSLLDQLPALKMPTLVMVGANDLPRPPKESQEMASLIPQARYQEIPNAGHICAIEQPEIVTDALLSFLSEALKNEDLDAA